MGLEILADITTGGILIRLEILENFTTIAVAPC